jgi:hypothetical protein
MNASMLLALTALPEHMAEAIRVGAFFGLSAYVSFPALRT